MQDSDPRNIVEAMLGDGDVVDPKELALSTDLGSELFEDFMSNYRKECMKLLETAKRSGAVPEDMPEGVLIRAVMQIAAENFRILTPQYKKELKNLRHFL